MEILNKLLTFVLMINDNNIPHGVVSPEVMEESPLKFNIVQIKTFYEYNVKEIEISNGKKSIFIRCTIGSDDYVLKQWVRERQSYIETMFNKFYSK